MGTLLILGAGGHARVVADAALASGSWQEVAFLDDRFPELTYINNWPVLGRIQDLEQFIPDFPDIAVGLGVSYDKLRVELISRAEKLGASCPVIIHPQAAVSPFATIASGSVVFANAVINIGAKIGHGCIINTAATVDHDCMIKDGAHISPGAHLAGNVKIGCFSWVGMGANIIQGLSVGQHARVGAGAVVTKNIENNTTVVGIPAYPVK